MFGKSAAVMLMSSRDAVVVEPAGLGLDEEVDVDADVWSPAPPHAAKITSARQALLTQTQIRSTGDSYERRVQRVQRVQRVHSAASNQSHFHGVIVSSGPAKETCGRSRSSGAIAAAAASGSPSSQATVICSRAAFHGVAAASASADGPTDQTPATPSTSRSATSGAD